MDGLEIHRKGILMRNKALIIALISAAMARPTFGFEQGYYRRRG
jgi:hypothetical protein